MTIYALHRAIQASYRRGIQRMLAGRKPLFRQMPDRPCVLKRHRNSVEGMVQRGHSPTMAANMAADRGLRRFVRSLPKEARA